MPFPDIYGVIILEILPMYRGACNDKSTIEDLTDLLDFSGILFIVDRGFYSAKNLKILSPNDNTYIIPVPSHTDVFKNAMKDVRYTASHSGILDSGGSTAFPICSTQFVRWV